MLKFYSKIVIDVDSISSRDNRF